MGKGDPVKQAMIYLENTVPSWTMPRHGAWGAIARGSLEVTRKSLARGGSAITP